MFHVFSGTFSFCAVVSTETGFTVVPRSDVVVADVGGAVGFFGFFFLLAFGVGRSVLGVGFEALGVTAGFEDLLLPALTVSREEISNMVGTERNSCCVIPPLSSSE